MRPRAAWSIAIPTLLLGIAVGVFLFIHPFEEMSPTLSPENQQLFKFVRTCPLAESRALDFEGNHSSYMIERRRCTREQLKDAPGNQRLRLSRMLDFVLINQHKPFHHVVLAGLDFDGECVGIGQLLQFSGKPVLLLTSVGWGSGGFGDLCFLGWMGDYVGCWHLPDEVTHAEKGIGSDEMLGHGLYPSVEGSNVVFGGQIGGINEGNCCPTHGELHIVLSPAVGNFKVERIYRTPPVAHPR